MVGLRRGSFSFHKKIPYKPNVNTIAYLPLEQNTADYSGKGNNGTGTNITYTTLNSGKKVATLSGSSRVDFSSSLFSSGSFTTSMWIYGNGLTSSSGALYVIMGNGASDSQGLIEDYHNYSGGYLRTTINNSGVHTQYGYSDKTWFLYTVTYNGSSVSTYKNGSLLGTTSVSFSGVRNFYLGYRAYSNDRYWKGYFSEFICENKARTAQEVSDYYNLTKDYYLESSRNINIDWTTLSSLPSGVVATGNYSFSSGIYTTAGVAIGIPVDISNASKITITETGYRTSTTRAGWDDIGITDWTSTSGGNAYKCMVGEKSYGSNASYGDSNGIKYFSSNGTRTGLTNITTSSTAGDWELKIEFNLIDGTIVFSGISPDTFNTTVSASSYLTEMKSYGYVLVRLGPANGCSSTLYTTNIVIDY